MNEIREQTFSFKGIGVPVLFSKTYIYEKRHFSLELKAIFPKWNYIPNVLDVTRNDHWRDRCLVDTVQTKGSEILIVSNFANTQEIGYLGYMSKLVDNMIEEFVNNFVITMRGHPVLLQLMPCSIQGNVFLRIMGSVLFRKVRNLIHHKESGLQRRTEIMEDFESEFFAEKTKQDLFDEERERALVAKERKKSENAERSWKFLETIVPKHILEEARKIGFLIVKNTIGEFHIPLCEHSFVSFFKDGKKECDYCLRFEDCSIPFGDEIAMKYTLLLSDPETFIQKANKIRRYTCTQ